MEKTLVIMFFMFLPLLSYGEGRKSLEISVNDICAHVSVVRYTNSTHPNGNKDGRHNEENDGVALQCYFDRGRNFYAKYGELRNSKNGNTPHYGFGHARNIIGIRRGPHGMHIRLGAEAVRVKYEIPKFGTTISWNRVLPYGGLKYVYGDKFFIGVNQYLLPGKVRLRSYEFVWQLKFNIQ